MRRDAEALRTLKITAVAVAGARNARYAASIVSLKNPRRRLKPINRCSPTPSASTYGRAARFHTRMPIISSIASVHQVMTELKSTESARKSGNAKRWRSSIRTANETAVPSSQRVPWSLNHTELR